MPKNVPSSEGEAFVKELHTAGKGKAKGELGVLKPGDEGYGQKASSELPQPTGPRVERMPDFQLSEDHEPEEFVRVVVPDPDPEQPTREIVLFSGPRKLYNQMVKAIEKDKAKSK